MQLAFTYFKSILVEFEKLVNKDAESYYSKGQIFRHVHVHRLDRSFQLQVFSLICHRCHMSTISSATEADGVSMQNEFGLKINMQ